MELIGRLTENARVNTTNSDKQVVNFSIALNDSYRAKDGETVKLTTYVECSYWRSTGIAEFLTKGTLVEVSGFLSADAYINMKGDPVGVIRCRCASIRLHGGNNKPPQTEATSQPQPSGRRGNKKDTPAAAEVAATDDLPF